MKNKVFIIILALVLCVSTVLGASVRIYPQDIGGHWSEKIVMRCIDREITQASSITRMWYPDAYILKADIVYTINRLCDFTETASVSKYTDLKDTDWWYKDFTKAVAAGYLQDRVLNKATPESRVNREEFMVMIARALRLPDSEFAVLDKYEDKDKVTPALKQEVANYIGAFGFNGNDLDGDGKRELIPQNDLTKADCMYFTDLAFDSYYADYVNTKPTDTREHWSYEIVEELIKRKIAGTDDKFNIYPDGEVFNADLYFSINNLLGLTEEADISKYTDVKETDWYYKHCQKAVKAGYVLEKNEATLGANKRFTREELFTMFAKALKLPDVENVDEILSIYEDPQKVAAKYKQTVANYLAVYPFNGNDTNGNGKRELIPQNLVTKADMYYFLYQIIPMEKVEIIEGKIGDGKEIKFALEVNQKVAGEAPVLNIKYGNLEPHTAKFVEEKDNKYIYKITLEGGKNLYDISYNVSDGNFKSEKNVSAVYSKEYTSLKEKYKVEHGYVYIKCLDENNNVVETQINEQKIGTTKEYKSIDVMGYEKLDSEEDKITNVKISKEYETKYLTYHYSNENEVPYISTYYMDPTKKPGEKQTVPYYVTDFYQKEYREDDTSKEFTVTVKVGDEVISKIEHVKAGDNSFELPAKQEEGKVEFSFYATDEYGRNSHELFNTYRVKNDIVKNEYVMTEADLATYEITNVDGREIIQNVEFDEIPRYPTQELLDIITAAYNETQVPSGKYMCFVPHNDNIAVAPWFKYIKVKYAEDYDKEAVLTEARKNRLGIQKLLEDKKAEGYNSVKLLKGDYRVDHEGGIIIPDQMTLDLNEATIKLNGFTGNSIGGTRLMVTMLNATDAHLINGTIDGDYFEHDYAGSPNESEWVNGVGFGNGSEYCSFENVFVKNITGYGVCSTSLDENAEPLYLKENLGTIDNSKHDAWKLGDIDRKTGEERKDDTRVTSEFRDISKLLPYKYLTVSIYLGYQGISGTNWNLICHFYDEDKNYIESIDTRQFRKIKIPENSKYLRVTKLDKRKGTDMSIYLMNEIDNCVYSDIVVENARCVGMIPQNGNNNIMQDCEVSKSGQAKATCGLDAEDGADSMRDYTFRRMNFHDNFINDYLLCGGHNYIVEDMVQGKIYLWEKVNSFVYKNSDPTNENIGMTINQRDRLRSGYRRIQDVTLGRGVTIQQNSIGIFDGKWPLYIKNCKIKNSMGAVVTSLGSTGIFKNCVREFNETVLDTDKRSNALQTGHFIGCTFNGASGNNGEIPGSAISTIYENCKILNLSGGMQGKMTFDNCEIDQGELELTSALRFYIKNSNIKNFRLTIGYWSKGVTNLEIDNCNIVNNKKDLLKIPNYSMVKGPITIKNSTFEAASTIGMIDFYDDRISSKESDYTVDAKPLTLENNEIKLPNSEYIITGISGTSRNNVNIVSKHNTSNPKIPLCLEGAKNNKYLNISEE